MDAIFSIPMLSVFLIPVLSSYSTSLNLLFFYMTWTTLVLSHTPLRVEIFGTIAVRFIFYALPSTLFFLFDILTPSAAVVIKSQGSAGLPGGKRRRNIRQRELKVAGWGLLNLCISIAVQWAIETICVRGLGARSALKVSLKLPMPYEMVKDFALGMLGREVLTYVTHRFVLHSEQSILARYHLYWYHSLRAPYPLTAHYDHPLTYLISNFIPTYLPAVFFRFHMLTYLLYLVVISIQETFTYSGYTVMPTSFFLAGISRRNDMHLLTDGEGNFGPLGIMDWICKTNVGDTDFEDDGLDEADEREQRARKQYQSGKNRKDRVMNMPADLVAAVAQGRAAERNAAQGRRRR